MMLLKFDQHDMSWAYFLPYQVDLPMPRMHRSLSLSLKPSQERSSRREEREPGGTLKRSSSVKGRQEKKKGTPKEAEAIEPPKEEKPKGMLSFIYSQTCFELPLIEKALCDLKTYSGLMQLKNPVCNTLDLGLGGRLFYLIWKKEGDRIVFRQTLGLLPNKKVLIHKIAYHLIFEWLLCKVWLNQSSITMYFINKDWSSGSVIQSCALLNWIYFRFRCGTIKLKCHRFLSTFCYI